MSAFADTDLKRFEALLSFSSPLFSTSKNRMRAAVLILLVCVAAAAMAAESTEPPKPVETPAQAPPPKLKKNGKSVLLWTFPYATSHNLVFAKLGRELAARGYTVRIYTVYLHSVPTQWYMNSDRERIF